MKSTPDPSHPNISLADQAGKLSPRSVACYALGSGLLALALSLCDIAPTVALLIGVLGLVVFGAS